MNTNTQQFTDTYAGSLGTSGSSDSGISMHGWYNVVCHDSEGNLKWEDEFPNLITTAGLKLVNDSILNDTLPGAAILGLKGTGTAANTDTQSSHAGWLEVGLNNPPQYNIAAAVVRGSPAFSAATNASPSVKTTSSAIVFTIVTTGGTVAGAFINLGGTTTIDNPTGILFSAGDFTAGSKVVTVGDTLSVTYILNAQ